LKDKSFDEQLIYLTCHLLNASHDQIKKLLVKKYLKAPVEKKPSVLAELKKTIEYQTLFSFWNPDSLSQFVFYREKISTTGSKISYEEREHRDSVDEPVSFESCFANLLINLKLVA
jgi:hypothetical protein